MEDTKITELLKTVHDMQTLLSTKTKENGQKDGIPNLDAILQAQFEKMRADILVEMDKKFTIVNPPNKEENKEKPKMNLGEFLLKVKLNHPDLAKQYIKTAMTEGTDAQGGYVVFPEYYDMIIGELTNMASIIPKCTAFPHNISQTKNLPKWLTDLAVYWVDEVGSKTQTKPTLTRKTSTLKKIAAIITLSDEFLQDSISGMETLLANRIARAIANEIERVALIGNTGAGDAFMGVLNSVGINTKAQAIAKLGYSDIVDCINNANMLEEYRDGAEFYMNRTSLGFLMNLVDGNGRPLWNLQSINGAMANVVLGVPINISSQITNTCSTGGNTSAIIYGNYKNIFLGYKVGNEGITVTASQHAVLGTGGGTGAITENAYQQDETFYRFVKRQGILVANPSAFTVITGVK